MQSRFGIPCSLAAAVAFALLWTWGCGDDETVVSTRAPRSFDIPSEMGFAEAAAQAVPGDTLNILFTLFPLSETVTIRGDQTPILIQGNKQFPILSGLHAGAVLRFTSPKAGTRIVEIGFSGGSPALRVEGGNELLVEECRFNQGSVQILGTGSGLSVKVSNTVMAMAGQFSLEMGGASLTSTGNTIDQAGDCGILLRDGAVGTVTRNIIWRSANYGIACIGGTLGASSGCNDVHQSGISSYLDCAAPADDISADPLFCAPDAPSNPDYRIRSDSPCAPLISQGCELIGALDIGCDP